MKIINHMIIQIGTILIFKYYIKIFKFIHSTIGLKIRLLILIQIFFITISFIVFSYHQLQITSLENSIHIADKNQFITSNLMTQITEYLFEDDTSNNIPKIKLNVINNQYE